VAVVSVLAVSAAAVSPLVVSAPPLVSAPPAVSLVVVVVVEVLSASQAEIAKAKVIATKKRFCIEFYSPSCRSRPALAKPGGSNLSLGAGPSPSPKQ
jgi:hypothetical protein